MLLMQACGASAVTLDDQPFQVSYLPYVQASHKYASNLLVPPPEVSIEYCNSISDCDLAVQNGMWHLLCDADVSSAACTPWFVWDVPRQVAVTVVLSKM